MTKQVTIPVVTRTQDNGDGGFTTYAYNNEDELIAAHPKSRRFDVTLKRYVPVELTAEQRQEILTDDDPYENGMIGQSTIVINIADDGLVTLAQPLRFHAGQ